MNHPYIDGCMVTLAEGTILYIGGMEKYISKECQVVDMEKVGDKDTPNYGIYFCNEEDENVADVCVKPGYILTDDDYKYLTHCPLPKCSVYKLGILDLPPVVFTEAWQKRHHILINEKDVWVARVWSIDRSDDVSEDYYVIAEIDEHEEWLELDWCHGFKPSDYKDGKEYVQERDGYKDISIIHKSKYRAIVIEEI